MRVKSVIGSTLAVLALAAGTASAVAAGSRDGANAPHKLATLRASTDAFHSIAVAEQHGYTLLQDANGIACIDMPGTGGMGVHWANSTLVGDPAIVAARPEALVYAPMPNGTLQLAALEYVVLKSAWDATHHHPPALFGHRFNVTPAPNRFGLPSFYSLHVWAWEQNPAGAFEMWNPRVVCPEAHQSDVDPTPGEPHHRGNDSRGRPLCDHPDTWIGQGLVSQPFGMCV